MNNSFIDRVNAIVQQNQTTEPVYPDAGIGALENVANNVPRQAQLMNQPHMLAYINPQEEQMLRDMGGAGLPGPDGIPVYGFFDWARDTASNIGSSFRETASNVYDTVSTGLTNTFGDQGSVEKFFDENVYDFDQDSTPDTTVYGTGPVEPVETTILPDPVTTVTAPLTYETNQSTKTFQELYDEALADGKKMFFHGGAYHTVTPVEEPVETTNSVVAQDLGLTYDQYGNRIEAGALPSTSNSLRETIANIITPFDGAKYIDGVLTNTTTGEDMTGGGTATGLFGENTVYGVSDDPTTGTTVDTTGMSESEISTAQVKDELLRDIPPDDLSYFGSFFANNVIPVFGGLLATKMLDQGIEGRKAYMDAEIAALESGATPTYNAAGEYTGHDTGAIDQYNLNYDPTGGNTTTSTGALPSATETDAAAAAEAAASMKDAGILTLGGKQIPDDPDNVGNTPIFQYNGSNGSYEVVGGLDPDNPATLSTNADGTLFIPYDGEDPHTISGDGFTTDLTPNGVAVANVVGKNHMLTTGDDSKMVVGIEGGGYKLIDGTELTNKVLENIITEGVNDGTLSADLLDTYSLEGGPQMIIDEQIIEDDPAVKSIYNKYYKSGKGTFLPAWLRRFSSGVSIDELLTKIEVDGEIKYQTPDGEIIDAKYITGAIVGPDTTETE